MVDVHGLLEVVGRRHELVAALEGGPATKPELVEAVGVSRSTVDRAVRELESRGVVERRNGAYRLTLFGVMVLEEFEAFRDRLAGLHRAEPLLASLPRDAPLESVALADAEVVTAARTEPYRPVDRHFELVGRADQTDVIGTALSPQYVSTYRERVVDGGMRLRAALPEDVMARLVTEYDDQLGEMLATGRVRLRELPEPPPFSLAVVRAPESTHLGVLVYGPDGVKGYVRNDSPAAIAWGRTCFERYWSGGTPIPAATGREA